MTKNPILNSLSALTYIIIISLVMNYGTKNVSGPDTILAPITVLSVFTLSAAFMGYTFLYNPVLMYLDGKKKEATNLFLKTLLSFGLITVVVLVLVFGKIIKLN